MRLELVKAAAEALGKLNGPERDFLKAYLVMSGRRKSADLLEEEPDAPEKRDVKRRGPDSRGHYKCGYCGKVLPTRRGRSIHEAAHDRQTAPEGQP